MSLPIKVYRLCTFSRSSNLTDKFFKNIDVTDIYPNNEISFLNYLEEICLNKEYIEFYKTISPDSRLLFATCLMMYYLGGFFINDKLAIENISLLNNVDLLSVKSCVHDNLFSGLLFSTKNNSVILKTIDDYISRPKESLNNILYKNIINEIVIKRNNRSIVLEETIKDDISYIKFNEDILAKHYFTLESLEMLIKDDDKKDKKQKKRDLKHLKIGITFDVPKTINDFYCNGIRQNALYFFELLKNMGYDVKLIIQGQHEQYFKSISQQIDFYKYEYSLLSELFRENYDLVFTFGFSLSTNIVSILKQQGAKVVFYQCGNSYLITTEKILYNQHDEMLCDGYPKSSDDTNVANQVWSIPQMYKQNKGFWEVLNRTSCIQVPFVWSNNSINFVKKVLNIDDESKLLYAKKQNKIGIFEPNISVMKWCLPCILICEKSYRENHNISHVYVTNTDIKKNPNEFKINKFNNDQFNSICKHFDITKDKKLSVEPRYITLDFMMKYADIALSHQWENPLNYLYLDLAWMGWPILHNAYLCKDVGYYYDEFDYSMASDVLKDIIDNHEKNKDRYLKKNRQIIDRYLPTNHELQKSYRNLIEALFK